MIPIIKNIRVVDEQGKDYGATYPKRARGLVKNGRARFINDDVICLACPPNKINDNNNYLEDIKMNNDILTQEEYNSNPERPVEPVFNSGKYTWEYALEQIEKIANNTEYIKEALKAIESIGESIGGSGSDKADAIKEAIKSREDTNRKLIEFYRAMYDDLKPVKPNYQQTPDLMMQIINKKIERTEVEELDMDEFMEFVNGIGELMQSVQKYKI